MMVIPKDIVCFGEFYYGLQCDYNYNIDTDTTEWNIYFFKDE